VRAEEAAAVAAVAALRREGVGHGSVVGLAFAPGVGLALAPATGGGGAWLRDACDPASLVAHVEEALRPRWVVWSGATAAALVAGGVRVSTCWDVAAVHRLVAGGWLADPGLAWATLHDLPTAGVPAASPPDLFSELDGAAADDPVRPDGYLDPAWAAGGWADTPGRMQAWAALAVEAMALQQARLGALGDRAAATARAESATELLCAELAADGLPMDRRLAEAVVAGHVGPRPKDEAEAGSRRAERDALVLRHAPGGTAFDLRSPGQVRSLLRSVGIEVPDTRAWRLEALRDAHPVVSELLAWRKAERVATTYGYGWLDEHLSPDGHLRGTWSSADGAAGRMTASAGLHNMPADMRAAVVAGEGRVFVRADLGQIEPRVLAAISGDLALARASAEDDMYAPVALELGVERPVAKVAVLGAMYGQTTGRGAEALQRLHSTYPVAMAHLDAADQAGQAGRDLRTHGGRLIRLAPTDQPAGGGAEPRGRAAARGRYARNAVVQGAAAELFKIWAVTVRARAAPLGARIVLCLHDELLVHAPAAQGEALAALVVDCLHEAVHRWSPEGPVRFVADVGVLERWSDAKG
jgi:DNA polymerase-1